MSLRILLAVLSLCLLSSRPSSGNSSEAVSLCLAESSKSESSCTQAASQTQAACGGERACLIRAQCFSNRVLAIRQLNAARSDSERAEALRRLNTNNCTEDFGSSREFVDYSLLTADPREAAAADLARGGKPLDAANLYRSLWQELQVDRFLFTAGWLYLQVSEPAKAKNAYQEFYLSAPGSIRAHALRRIEDIDRRTSRGAGADDIFADRLFKAQDYGGAARAYLKASEAGEPAYLLPAARSFLRAGEPEEALIAARAFLDFRRMTVEEAWDAEGIIAHAERLGPAVRTFNRLLSQRDFRKASDALLADQEMAANAVYLCRAGAVLDRWDGDVERAKVLYGRCLAADASVFDAEYFRARVKDEVVLPMFGLLKPITRTVWKGARVWHDCDVSYVESGQGYQLAGEAELPPGYLFKRDRVSVKRKIGNVEYEVRAAKSMRRIFFRLTAKNDESCNSFLGFTWGDRSELEIDLDVEMIPYPGTYSDVAPQEVNPFFTGPLETSVHRVQSPPKRSSCRVAARQIACPAVYILSREDPGCSVICAAPAKPVCREASCSPTFLAFSECYCQGP